MNKSRQETMKEYNSLLAMRQEVEKELLKIPGVIRVGVGARLKDNQITGELCFRVYVEKKKNPADIPKKEMIPAEIRGIKIDVNEMEQGVSFSDEDTGKYRPMSAGARIRTSNAKTNGTFGCIALDDDAEEGDDSVVLLSCFHILMARNEEPGHQVAQPKFCCESCCCRCGEIAKVVRGAWDDQNVDCAIARLSNGNQNNWTNEILELGYVSCIPLDSNKDPIDPQTNTTTDINGLPYHAVLPFDTVFKRGMNTRLTEGVVVETTFNITFDVPLEDGTIDSKTFNNQIRILPKFPGRAFSGKGDSGSVVLNHLNQVIGLFFADNEQRDPLTGQVTQPAGLSIANPIQDVLKVLRITIPDTGTFLSIPLRSGMEEARISKKDISAEAIKMIKEHPDGTLLLSLFEKHSREVLELINTDREVKVTWNRYQGPLFTAHLMKKIRDRDYKMPLEIENISCQRLLLKMSVVLEKKGSPEMAADIEKYSAKLLALGAEVLRTLNEQLV